MIRLANPGSNIDGMTRIFQALVEDLSGRDSFDLDDITDVVIARNLMTAYGFSGDEARTRSTRKDRSRDGLYNNSKMYSELYRLLGWIRPTDKQLRFRMTWLGEHVKEAGDEYKKLVMESLLGIAFPNPNLGAKGSQNVRLFATILRVARDLGGSIARDEIIAGPMSILDDRNPATYAGMLASLRRMRTRPGELEARLDEISAEREIARNTMCNYTRFPLAAVDWAGWTRRESSRAHHGKTIEYRSLTPAGAHTEAWLRASRDLRAADLSEVSHDAARAASVISTLDLLVRSGFGLGDFEHTRTSASAVLVGTPLAARDNQSLLFSVFQEGSDQLLERAFPRRPAAKMAAGGSSPRAGGTGTGRAAAFGTDIRMEYTAVPVAVTEGPAVRLLRASVERVGRDVTRVLDVAMADLRTANQTEFYPFVADLFRILGFDCKPARAGVNYQRADAFITHATMSVPIEIKSPGEELLISVKGVRQAAENKVILLARKAAPTTRGATSLVVGYLPPNERAEVSNLIEDIRAAFQITIGVIDLRSLLKLAYSSLYDGRRPDHQALLTLRGFINVIDT